MPTYEYECGACHNKWELFQSITSNPVKKCPKCGKNKAQRLIGTGMSIIFKGSGFYTTDYRSDSYKKDAKADADASSGKKSDSKPGEPGTKSESKPAETKSEKSEKSEKKGKGKEKSD